MELNFLEKIKPEAILAAYERDFKENKIMNVLIVFFQTGEFSRCFRMVNVRGEEGTQKFVEFGNTTEEYFIEDDFELNNEHLYVANYFMYNEDLSFLENLVAAAYNDEDKMERVDLEFIKRMFVLKKEGSEQ